MSLMTIGMLVLGFSFNAIQTMHKAFYYTLHKSTGLVLLIFVVVRLIMRVISKYPPLPENTPALVVFLSKSNVLLLYTMMVIMPASGFLMSTLAGHPLPFFGFFQIPAIIQNLSSAAFCHRIHSVSSILFVITICLHVGGGLFHQFVLKDNLLKRML